MYLNHSLALIAIISATWVHIAAKEVCKYDGISECTTEFLLKRIYYWIFSMIYAAITFSIVTLLGVKKRIPWQYALIAFIMVCLLVFGGNNNVTA